MARDMDQLIWDASCKELKSDRLRKISQNVSVGHRSCQITLYYVLMCPQMWLVQVTMMIGTQLPLNLTLLPRINLSSLAFSFPLICVSPRHFLGINFVCQISDKDIAQISLDIREHIDTVRIPA